MVFNESVDDEINKQISIRFKCPICKAEKELLLDKKIINQAKQLTTVSIPQNTICPHHFQAFIDKDFKVRGYQKVDFAFDNKTTTNQLSDDNTLFDQIKFYGNKVEYIPKESNISIQHINSQMNKKQEVFRMDKIKRKNKIMNIKEIYNQFWEFIDDSNPLFREFIINDPRRGGRIDD